MKYKYLFFIAFAILIQSASAQTVYEDFQDGRICFKLKDDVDISGYPEGQVDVKLLPALEDIHQTHKIRSLTRPFTRLKSPKSYRIERMFMMNIADIYAIDQVIRKIEQWDQVEYVHKMPRYKVFYTPNDAKFAQAWHLPKIQAPEAWDLHKGDPNIKVAIVDDGVDCTHPDLNVYINKIEQEGAFGVDDDGNGLVDDVRGWNVTQPPYDPADPPGQPDGHDVKGYHGTHVAGIACAKADNGIGIAGSGFSCSLIPIDGGGNGFVDYPFSGIYVAGLMGADVINMSFGSPTNPPGFQDMIDALYAKDIVLVAGAGNSNTEIVHYPAGHTNVISVAATNEKDERAVSLATGNGSTYNTNVNISAPGINILSTIAGGSYANSGGTSMSSPLIAGVLALMRAANPDALAPDIINCLYSSADDIEANLKANEKGKMGAGRVNAYKAVQCALAIPKCTGTGVSLPLVEGFDNATFPPANWSVNNPDGKITWSRHATAGKSAAGSAYVKNSSYDNGQGQQDDLILQSVDLTGVSVASMTFQYAHANYSPPEKGYSDKLDVLVSLDCGRNNTQLAHYEAPEINTAPNTESEFVPTSSQWKLAGVDLTPYVGNKNVTITFKQTSDWENNLYIDDINIAAKSLTVGFKELQDNASMILYPNPSSGHFNLKMDFDAPQDVLIRVTDILGKEVYRLNEQGSINKLVQLDLSYLNEGIYLVSLISKDLNITRKITIRK